jgi:hypothetical protein
VAHILTQTKSNQTWTRAGFNDDDHGLRVLDEVSRHIYGGALEMLQYLQCSLLGLGVRSTTAFQHIHSLIL